MKIIMNSYIPFSGYVAMAFYNVIIWRKEYKFLTYALGWEKAYKKIVNHESIHNAQMKDFCKWVPVGGTIFYLVYFFEWLFKVLFMYPFSKKAYKNISFEKEAKQNEENFEYLATRKKFAQWK